MPRLPVLGLVLAVALASGAAAAEKRCGWIVNPTPGNYWLTDSSGDWIMATQGGAEAEGMDLVPDLSTHDFVKTNGEHGYACGCVTGVFDARAQKVVKIAAVAQKRLSACRKDAKLKRPD